MVDIWMRMTYMYVWPSPLVLYTIWPREVLRPEDMKKIASDDGIIKSSL